MIVIEQKYAVNDDGRVVNRQSGRPVHEGEPLMLFRATDAKLPAMLVHYMAECQDPMHREAVARRLVEILEWQRTHPTLVHEPDTDLNELWNV